jgi:hypothetical protein
LPTAATTGGHNPAPDPPARPRRWFGALPDNKTIRFCVTAAAIIAVPGFLWLKMTVQALRADGYLPALAVGLLPLLAFSLAAVILIPIISPPPRVRRSAEGLSISPAWVVSAGIVAVGILLMVVLVMLGVAVIRGDTLTDSRRALGLPGLALFTIVILVPFMARAIRTRFRRGRAGYLVTLTPAGIQFSDMGRPHQLPWDQIIDIRPGRRDIRWTEQIIGPPELYLYSADRSGGQNIPLMVDRWLQMGGPWLADTLRYYWQHPDTRSQLATGSGQAPDPAANTAAHPWPRADQPGPTPPTPATEARRRRRVLALLAAAFAAAAALGLLWDRPEPPAANQFANGGSITVVLTRPESRGIYVAHEHQKPGCEVSSPDPDANAVIQDKTLGHRYRGPMFPRTAAKNDSFEAFQDFHARRAGTYIITCSADPAAVFRLQGPTRPIDVVYGIIGFVGLVAFLRLGYRSWRRRRTPEPVTLTVPDY